MEHYGKMRTRYRSTLEYQQAVSMEYDEHRHWDDNLTGHWCYDTSDGASEWGLDFPEANGICQSPINLTSREAVYDDTLNVNPLTLNYVLCRETDICNNGNSLIVYLRYKPGDAGFRSDVTPKSTLSGGPLPVGHEFELAEIRFHWGREDGRGSEHTVNCKAFPMELHLIHYNTTLYSSFEQALGKPKGVAIIAIFIQVGREHSGLKLLTDNLEDVQHKVHYIDFKQCLAGSCARWQPGRQKTLSTAFSPNCLLPDPMLRDFWTYPGSLTIPPCNEQVTWIMFRYPLTVSHVQIEEFRRLRTHHKGEPPVYGDDGALVDNFRPTQPLNDRVIRASFQ